MRKFLRWIGSYLFGVKLAEYPSSVSGTLELWLINGRKVVNGPNVNYSFASLHQVFQRVFRSTALQKNPPSTVLVLGFGAGSVAHILTREYGFTCHMTGVDLDPVMLQLAQEHFGQKPSPTLLLFAADAVEFVASDTRMYDLIVIDIFVDDQVPDVIAANPFITQVLNRLLPQGRLYLNLMTSNEPGKRQLQHLKQIMGNKQFQILHPVEGNAVFYFVQPL